MFGLSGLAALLATPSMPVDGRRVHLRQRYVCRIRAATACTGSAIDWRTIAAWRSDCRLYRFGIAGSLSSDAFAVASRRRAFAAAESLLASAGAAPSMHWQSLVARRRAW